MVETLLNELGDMLDIVTGEEYQYKNSHSEYSAAGYIRPTKEIIDCTKEKRYVWFMDGCVDDMSYVGSLHDYIEPLDSSRIVKLYEQQGIEVIVLN